MAWLKCPVCESTDEWSIQLGSMIYTYDPDWLSMKMGEMYFVCNNCGTTYESGREIQKCSEKIPTGSEKRSINLPPLPHEIVIDILERGRSKYMR